MKKERKMEVGRRETWGSGRREGRRDERREKGNVMTEGRSQGE